LASAITPPDPRRLGKFPITHQFAFCFYDKRVAVFDSSESQRRERVETAFARKPVRAGIFVETGLKNSKAPSGVKYAAPTELDSVWVWFYKDVAPMALLKGANPAK
jgi:hypothetical protein